MNAIPLWGQVTAFLSFIGFSGFVGLLFGRWLTRGRPSIFLTEIESATGVSPVVKPEIITLPENIVQLSQDFRWVDYIDEVIIIDEVTTIGDLAKISSKVRWFNYVSEKALHKAENLFRDISRSNIGKDEKIRITKQLLTDDILSRTLLSHLRMNEFELPSVSERDAVFFLEEKTTPEGFIVFMINLEDFTLPVGYRRLAVDEEIRRLRSFLDIIKYADTIGIKKSLSFTKNILREQRDIAEQIINSIQPVMQSTSTFWQAEVIAANRGERIVLLSPYARLITKGGRRSLPDLPLTVLPTTAKEGDQADDYRMKWNGEFEPHSDKYIVLEPQSAHQITFLSDVEVSNVGKYAALYNAYEADILSCSVVMKREDRRGLQRNAIVLRSPWVSFGAQLAQNLRNEIEVLAHKPGWLPLHR